MSCTCCQVLSVDKLAPLLSKSPDLVHCYIKSLQNQNQAQKKQIQMLSTKIQNDNQNVLNAQKITMELEKKQREFGEIVQKVQTRCQELQRENDQMKELLKQKSHKLHSVTMQVQDLLGQISRAMAQKQKIEKEFSQVKRKLETEINKIKKQNSFLKENSSKYEQLYNQSIKNKETFHLSVEKFVQQNQKLKNQLLQLKQIGFQWQKQTKKKYSSIENQNQLMRSSLKVYEEQLEKLNQDLQKCESLNLNLEKQLQQNHKKYILDFQKWQRNKKQVEKYVQFCEISTQEMQKLILKQEKQIEALQETNKTLRNEIIVNVKKICDSSFDNDCKNNTNTINQPSTCLGSVNSSKQNICPNINKLSMQNHHKIYKPSVPKLRKKRNQIFPYKL